MSFDKGVALFFLIVSVIYGYAAYNYPLLPFERNMTFLPNTMPKILAVCAIFVSGFIVVAPKTETEKESDKACNEALKDYNIKQTSLLILSMIAYALSIRTLGFIFSTIAFIVTSGWILGERKPFKMISIATIATVFIWYLTQEVLGIFLKPLPNFLEGVIS